MSNTHQAAARSDGFFVSNLRPTPGKSTWVFDLATPEFALFSVKLIRPANGPVFIALPRFRLGAAWVKIGSIDSAFAQRVIDEVQRQIHAAGGAP